MDRGTEEEKEEEEEHEMHKYDNDNEREELDHHHRSSTDLMTRNAAMAAAEVVHEAVEAVDGAIIVGAGPAGLAAAACLERHNVPYLILERSSGIAPLWRCRTYDRLRLHTPAHHCSLPYLPFPRVPSEVSSPFPTREAFLRYLHVYAATLLRAPPAFQHQVISAEYDTEEAPERWLVRVEGEMGRRRRMAARWLVVAAGENGVPRWPEPQIDGLRGFKGRVLHSWKYRNAGEFVNRRVLVVGAGNSGMEIALDLTHHSVAHVAIVARSPVHVLPREILGMSTFAIGVALCKIFPVRFVDKMLVAYSQMKFGDTFQYGLKRPKIGPLELKKKLGKTPILDVGTFNKIQNGEIKVKPAIDSINEFEVRFVDSTIDTYDAIIVATGYKSTISTWLKDDDNFLSENGLPKCTNQSQNQSGKKGLYACGLSGRGLLGASADALYIAQDIKMSYFSHKSP